MLEMALYRSPCCSHSLTFRRQGPRNPDVRRRTQRVPSCHGGINATVNSPIRSTKPQTACPGHDLLSFDNDRRARWELTNVLIKTNTAMPSVRIWQCRRWALREMGRAGRLMVACPTASHTNATQRHTPCR